MEKTQKMDIPAEWLAKLKEGFNSARVPDDRMCDAMRREHADCGYIACPHTSVALAGADDLGYFDNDTPVAIMATASPVKFQKNCTFALGEEVWTSYENSSSYPANAKGVNNASEVEPLFLDRNVDETLEDAQARWTEALKEIIEKTADA